MQSNINEQRVTLKRVLGKENYSELVQSELKIKTCTTVNSYSLFISRNPVLSITLRTKSGVIVVSFHLSCL